MDAATLIAQYAQRLELVLIHDFGARGASLAQTTDSVADELPGELTALLRRSAADLASSASGPVSDEDAIAFVFRCGQLIEKLDTFRQASAADMLVFVDTDGRTVTDSEGTDLDRLSRFLVIRDRFLRKAADFSLKVLVAAVLIVALGFAFGLI